MNKLIYIFVLIFLSNVLIAQEKLSEVVPVTHIDVYNKSLNFSQKDSVLIDSIQYLISQAEKLTQKIYSLTEEEYSRNTIRYSYRKYTDHLNNMSKIVFSFLLSQE